MSEPDWDYHCAEKAAAVVRESTGRDIWAELGGCPHTRKEAAALYRRKKVRSLAGIMDTLFGEAVDPKLAMRGDVAMVDGALGIVRGDLVECFDRMQPIGRATKAWKATGRPRRRA